MRSLRATVPESAFYHVTSRALEKRFIFDEPAAEVFRGFMRQVEAFTGVRVVTYCVMSNHFHLLLHVPKRQAIPDAEMLARLENSFSPKAFASGDSAMQQPSPLPRTTAGTPRMDGSQKRSQDT